MLIIFDLDDTLVDTSTHVIPIKLKLALQAMVDAGLEVEDFDTALKELLNIDKNSPRGKDSLKRFLEKIGGNMAHFSKGVQVYYEDAGEDFQIEAFPGVIKSLKELMEEHTLALVSVGAEEEQFRKMKVAGIDPSWFKKILITNNYKKGEEYEQVMRELGYPSFQVLVCGDKVKGDLLPAKERGCVTVHMQRGRGARDLDTGLADYSITNLNELREIITKCRQ